MSTTTTFTPSYATAYSLSGVPLSSFPVDNDDLVTGIYTDYRPSPNSWNVSASLRGRRYLQEVLTTGGTPQRFNSIWTGPNTGYGSDPGAFGVYGATYSLGGTYPPAPSTAINLGAWTMEVQPYVHGMVCRDTGGDYTPVAGVKVTVTLGYSDGRTYKLLDGNALSAPSVSSATYLPAHNPNGFQDNKNPGENRLVLQTGQGITWPYIGAATPAKVYDPYFGRLPSDPKSLSVLILTLEWPSGRVWTAATTCGQNYANGNGRLGALVPVTTGLGVGTVMSGSGGNIGVNYSRIFDGVGASDYTYSSAGATPGTSVPFSGGIGIMGLYFLFVLQPGFDEGPPSPTIAAASFRRDATGRPSFATAGGSGVSLLTSRDAGHTYQAYAVSGAAGTDPSLLVDPGTNTHRVLVTTAPASGVATWRVLDATKDGEQGDWGSPVTLTALHGAWPACAQHPQDPMRVACLYLDGGVLKLGMSYDFGAAASWAVLSAVGPTGLDFATSGRGCLAWLGEALLAVWCDGSALKCKVSTDGGHTWPGSAVTVATGGPYYGPSAAGLLGAFYVLASTASASKVYRSGDMGVTWAATAADPAPQTPGAALGADPVTGRLLLGSGTVSADDGATFAAA